MTFAEWQTLMGQAPRVKPAQMSLGELAREWLRLRLIDRIVRGNPPSN